MYMQVCIGIFEGLYLSLNVKLLKVSIYIEGKSVDSGDKSFSIILRHERNRRLTINYRYQVRRESALSTEAG